MIEPLEQNEIETLTTHDSGNKITERDTKFTAAIEDILK